MATVRDTPGTSWLRVTDVAGLLGVSANTVRRWTDAGRIAAFRSPGGHRRYLAADVLALLPNTEIAGATVHPGDFSEVQRQNHALRAALAAGLDVADLLADKPEDVPEKVARTLRDLTGSARCDVCVTNGDRLLLVASAAGGGVAPGAPGATWPTAERVPVDGDPAAASVVWLRAGDRTLDRRARLALERRGCKALAWTPLTANGELAGSLELIDHDDRDLSVHTDLLGSLARICTQAIGIAATYHELDDRENIVRELTELSRDVSHTHDLERFVTRFAGRLLTAVDADCVDVFRAHGGVIRALVSVTHEGADTSRRGADLDTARYPSLERTLLDLTPLAINDLGDPRLGRGEADAMREWGYASSLTVPLVAGGELVGLVDLYDDVERDWETDLEFLTSVCQIGASHLDGTTLLDEARERARLGQELLELGEDVAAAEASADIAARAAARLRRVAGCADCDIWWSEEGYLRCLASVDGDGLDESVSGKLLELDHYPSTREALRDREVLVVRSLQDPRITEYEREDRSDHDFRSTMSVPLVSNDAVVGLIDLHDTRERDYREVRWFMESAGRSIADALRSAELLAGLRRGDAALRELAKLGDRLNQAGTLEDLARAVAERLRASLNAEDCDIWQIDGGVLRCLASIDSNGWDEEEVGSERDLASYEATLSALSADEPMVIGDLSRTGLDERELQAYRRWGYESMVSLPLVVNGRPIGLIDVFDTRVRDYSGLLDFIRNVGHLLAGSFENAMLVERLEEGNRDLRLLVDSGMEFGATLEAEAVLSTVSERILDVARADMCDVYRLDGDELEILVSVGEAWEVDPSGSRFRLQDYGIFSEAAEKRRPVVSLDVRSEPGMTPMEVHDAEKWDYRSCLDIPLISQGEVIGFISLMNHDVRAFAREEVVVGLAQIAGQAIANAGLYRELDENLRRMALVGESALELASSLDLQATLVATAKRLCSTVGVAECEITIIEGEELHTLMRVNDGEVDTHWLGQRLSLGDAAVTREVIATKRPTVVGSLRDPRLTPVVLEMDRGYDRKSWATLPLIAKGKVIGTVELVDSQAERSFSPRALETAAAISHAAALAIENAALFAREQATTRATQLLNDIARRTAASLDLEEVVEAAVDELRQLVDFDEYSLLLLDGDAIGRVISSRPQAETLVGMALDEFGSAFVERLASERVSVLRIPEDLPVPADHPALVGVGQAAMIALPSDNGLLGTLDLLTNRRDGFVGIDTDLLERVGMQLALAVRNTQLYDEIKQMHLGNLKALSSALNAKDYYTLGHAARVAAYTVMLGRELGWPDDLLTLLQEAAYLHDIGKISISDRVLLKPGRLNPQEWEQMREHPVVSADIIQPLFPSDLVLAVRHHHERHDGGGYPEGLKGKNIPLGARIIHLADLFDRHLYPGGAILFQNRATAMARVSQAAGKELDPEVAKVFVERCYQRTGELDGEEIELSPASLQPGMVLSRDIYNVNEVILLKEGTLLSANHIAKLNIHEGFDPVLSRAFVRRRSVQIPELKPGVVAVHAEARMERPVAASSPLLVVVDDEKMVVEALRRELVMDDYEVESFTDPLRVCPFLQENAGKVMAVLSDLKMPGLDGVRLAEAIHAQWPSLPVVVITAHATVDSVLGLKRSEVLRVLTKPWDKFELLKILGDIQAARR